ncbi:MAG: DNA cytosine methyltransferase [Deltaproteobacteria bacterium]|jgi:DNA (cytosine-5)-methyltransferase 1|nr:DNA cytosine methyltransferase [Deltaproteobacteria bacterium]
MIQKIKKSPEVIDLFCGIGGLTHGLRLAGLNVVAGIDIDASCKYPYETNNDAIFIENDIELITSQTINSYFNDNSLKILVGCAPCQPFSTYTHRYRKKGRLGDKWKLLNLFAQKIDDIYPDIISMENVPELKHESIFHEFVQSLINKRYHIHYSVAFCPDYGVPQLRKRLVLLASLHGDIKLINPLFTKDTYKTVKDTIGELSPIENGERSKEDILHYCSKLTKINMQRIKASVPGGSWRDWDDSLQLNCHKKITGRSYLAIYGRMSWEKPSPTITTQFYGYGNGRFGHPEQDRALSIREGALLQSFPPEYKFISPDCSPNTRSLGVKIGNAVPVELGRAIGVSILTHIKESVFCLK